MATVSITQRALAQKRRPPDPARVYETYLHECRNPNEWGAYARTAARYRKPDGSTYSDEWARKVVKKHLERTTAATVEPESIADELAYTPPPFAYPERRPLPTNALLRQPVGVNLPTSSGKVPTGEGDITAVANGRAANSQPGDGANFQPVELDNTPVIATANRQQDEPPAGPPHIRPQSDPAPDRPQSPTSPGHARPEIDDSGSEMPNLPPESFPDPSPNQPPLAELTPQLTTQGGATYATSTPVLTSQPVATHDEVSFRSPSPTVRAYLATRHELVTVAPARRGLYPALRDAEYRGFILGFLIWLGLMLLVAVG